jgi:hypothetical protein
MQGFHGLVFSNNFFRLFCPPTKLHNIFYHKTIRFRCPLIPFFVQLLVQHGAAFVLIKAGIIGTRGNSVLIPPDHVGYSLMIYIDCARGIPSGLSRYVRPT